MSGNNSKSNSPREWEELVDISVLQQRAVQLLALCDPKPVIALDLDYTLWPANCFEHTAPPYKANIGREMMPGSTVQDHIYCLCRKSNSIRSFSMYPQTRSILEFIVDHNVAMTICSRSPDRNVVKQILSEFGMWDWFLFPQIYTQRKTFHFRNLNEATGLQMKSYLFYDDEAGNIAMCSRIGVNCCLVDKRTGLTWNTFVKGLHLFYSKQRSSRSLQQWLISNSQKQDSSDTLTTFDSDDNSPSDEEASPVSVVETPAAISSSPNINPPASLASSTLSRPSAIIIDLC